MAVRIEMPKLGLNMKEGLLVEWLVDQGEEVEKDQALFVVETEKVTNEVTAQKAGILHQIAEEGDSFPVLGLVGYILAPGEEAPAPQGEDQEENAIAAKNLEQTAAPVMENVRSSRILASPKAKRRAKELGIKLEDVEGTGPNGRIGFDDVEKAVEKLKAGEVTEDEAVPLSTLRKTIAKHMSKSHQQTAPVTLMAEGDASALIKFRADLNANKDEDDKISYNAILIKLTAKLLERYPLLNASYDDETLTTRPVVNVGLAMDLEKGLLVPVVERCEKKSLGEINQEIQDNYQKVISNNYTNDDLTGNTFTITNLGALGITYFTPIINQPDVAILGVGKIKAVAVDSDGDIEMVPTIFLSLTFDHRWVDGAYGAKFLHDFLDAIASIDAWL